jgi:hypothetical protein
MKKLLLFVVALILVPAIVQGAVVATEDFDGGAVNLVSSSVPALDGGGGDYFGVGSRNAWPQGFPPGVPFSLADDTVISYSDPSASPFSGDNEGIFGENSNLDNVYFAISDTREWTSDQLVASWTFDITGYVDLSLSVDIGGISNASSGGYSTDTDISFVVKVDGGPDQLLLHATAIDYNGFVLRPMDNGNVSGGGRLLEVSGDNGVTKLLAEDGSAAANAYVDKSVPSGPGAGHVDTFKAPITGTGLQVEVIMTANVPFEAAAFDNIVIEGDVSTATKNSSWGRLKSLYR